MLSISQYYLLFFSTQYWYFIIAAIADETLAYAFYKLLYLVLVFIAHCNLIYPVDPASPPIWNPISTCTTTVQQLPSSSSSSVNELNRSFLIDSPNYQSPDTQPSFWVGTYHRLLFYD